MADEQAPIEVSTPITPEATERIKALQSEALYGPAVEARQESAQLNYEIELLRGGFANPISNQAFAALPPSERLELIRVANEKLTRSAQAIVDLFHAVRNLTPEEQRLRSLSGRVAFPEQIWISEGVPTEIFNLTTEEINKRQDLVHHLNVLALERDLQVALFTGQPSGQIQAILADYINQGIPRKTYDEGIALLKLHIEQQRRYQEERKAKLERGQAIVGTILKVVMAIRIIVTLGADFFAAWYDYITTPDVSLPEITDVQAAEAAGIPGYGQVAPEVNPDFYDPSLTPVVSEGAQAVGSYGLAYGINYAKAELQRLLFSSGQPTSGTAPRAARTPGMIAGGAGGGGAITQPTMIEPSTMRLYVMIGLVLFGVFLVYLLMRRRQ